LMIIMTTMTTILTIVMVKLRRCVYDDNAGYDDDIVKVGN